MEDVCAVAVDVDALQPLGAGVAADVRPSFDDEALLPRLICFVGEHAAEQPRPHDEIVVLRHSLLLCAYYIFCPNAGSRGPAVLFYCINSAGEMQPPFENSRRMCLGACGGEGKEIVE